MNNPAVTQAEASNAPPLPDHLRQFGSQNSDGDLRLFILASEWYEVRGETGLAIRHALAGKGWSRAAYLIDRMADSVISGEKKEELQSYLAELPAEILSNWPRLEIVRAHLYVLGGELESAQLLLDEIGAGLESQDGRAGWHLPPLDSPGSGLEALSASLEVVQAELALKSGQFETAFDLAGKALASLPLSCPVWSGLAAHCAGEVLAGSGKLEAAAGYFAQSRRAANQAGSLSLELSAGLKQVECLWLLGRLREALELCQDLQSQDFLARMLEAGGMAPDNASRLYAVWAELLAAGGRLDEALAAGMLGVNLAGERQSARAEADLALARVHLARKEYPAARRILDAGEPWPENYPLRATIFRIDLDLDSGHTGQAFEAIRSLGMDPAGDLRAEPIELRRLAARLLLAQGRIGEALARLQDLHREELHSGREQSSVETLILLALAYQALEDEQACLDELSQALFLAASQGWLLPFLSHGRAMSRILYRAAAQDIQPDFISQLLDRFPPDQGSLERLP